MKPQFDHTVLSSFYLWFDDKVTRVAEAQESGINQQFYYSSDSVDVPSNQVAYYSPDRQFVSNGDNVPSGVYAKGGPFGVNYVFVDQQPNTSIGLMIDHDQGRVIFNSNVGPDLEVSGNFSRKTLNTYITNESEEELLLNTDFLLSNQDDATFLQSINGLGSLKYTLPAAFLSYNSSSNQPFALGGMQDTKSNIRSVVIANDNFSLDATLSLFRDLTESCVPIIEFEDFPYGEYFHIKNPPYNYENLYNNKVGDGNHIFIEKVTCSKLLDTASSAINIAKNMRIGFIDFYLSTPRFPKILK